MLNDFIRESSLVYNNIVVVFLTVSDLLRFTEKGDTCVPGSS